MSAAQPQIWRFQLGGISLSKFEVPSGFKDGVDAHIAVHRYVNEQGQAATKVQGLGSFPLPTTWNGKLRDGSAIRRHLQLKTLAAAMQPISFVYGPLQYSVVITRYEGNILHQLMVDYTIELTVISEKTGAIPSAAVQVSFDVGTQAIYDTAAQAMSDLQVADTNLSASILAANANVTALLQASYPLKLAPIISIVAIISSIGSLSSQLQAYAAPLQQNGVLESDLQRLDAALRALAAFTLLVTNLNQLVGSTPSAQTITLSYGNVYAIASQYYPNSDVPTIADMLASANGLTDYWVTSKTTLVLPPVFT